MIESYATLLLWHVAVYLGLGLLVAVLFVLRGVGAVDPDAEEGSWGFRLLILPGCAALWPLIVVRWARGGERRREREPHRLAARRPEGAPTEGEE